MPKVPPRTIHPRGRRRLKSAKRDRKRAERFIELQKNMKRAGES